MMYNRTILIYIVLTSINVRYRREIYKYRRFRIDMLEYDADYSLRVTLFFFLFLNWKFDVCDRIKLYVRVCVRKVQCSSEIALSSLYKMYFMFSREWISHLTSFCSHPRISFFSSIDLKFNNRRKVLFFNLYLTYSIFFSLFKRIQVSSFFHTRA